MYHYFKSAHPVSKIIFTLLIMLASFFAVMLVGFLLAIPIFNLSFGDLAQLLENTSSYESVRFLKYLQTLQTIGMFVIPGFLIAYLFSGTIKEYLFLEKFPYRRIIFILILIMIAAFPIINFTGLLNSQMSLPDWLSGIENWMKEQEALAQSLTKSLVGASNISGLLFNLFMIAVLPAIGEELIFRGIIQRILCEWTKSVHWGIFIAAFFFSFFHLQFYGFLPRFLLGVLFGYLFVWSGTLWVPILAHFINNAAAVMLYYFYSDTLEVESFGASNDTFYFPIISAVVLTMLLIYFKKNAKAVV